MGRLAEAFARAKSQGRPALIPYAIAGYPDLDRLPALLEAMASAHADIIEIGIPFSDPLADGPVLQRASTSALAQGTKVRDILARVRECAPSLPPLVFMTYLNPVFRYGMGEFARDARAAGIEGLIIPDLPWSEAGEMRTAAKNSNLALIPLVAPTSTQAHLAQIRRAQGFVYAVSVTGVTGARSTVDAGVRELVARVRAASPLPVAVGFGISSPEQAREVGSFADGVIVASALVKAISEAPDQAEAVAFRFVSGLYEALVNIKAKA